MITSAEFLDRMRSLKPNCYMHGELLQRDDPRMLISMKDILMTYDVVDDPRFRDLVVTESHLTGKPINRFTHIHQSVDDLLKKQLLRSLVSAARTARQPPFRRYGRLRLDCLVRTACLRPSPAPR